MSPALFEISRFFLRKHVQSQIFLDVLFRIHYRAFKKEGDLRLHGCQHARQSYKLMGMTGIEVKLDGNAFLL